MMQDIKDYIQNRTGDFNSLALRVFAYQYENCKPYQNYCNALGKTPLTVNAWQDIPPVSTEVFREFDLCTLSTDDARYIFQTSGTSKEAKGKHYYHDMTLYDVAIQSSFMRALDLSGETVFRVLTPSFKEISTSSLFYMFDRILAWYGAPDSRFYMQNDVMDHVQLIQDLQNDIQQDRPAVLLGSAFSYVNLWDYLQEQQLKLSLPVGSKLLETGGLKGRVRSVSREELYGMFVSHLGLDVNHCYSEYGMTELSSQSYSHPNSHIFQSPPWMPVRIIDPEQGNEVAIGETGLVQFFDLANVTAVSAIITSDLAVRHAHGFELKGRAPKAVLRGCSTAFEK